MTEIVRAVWQDEEPCLATRRVSVKAKLGKDMFQGKTKDGLYCLYPLEFDLLTCREVSWNEIFKHQTQTELF